MVIFFWFGDAVNPVLLDDDGCSNLIVFEMSSMARKGAMGMMS